MHKYRRNLRKAAANSNSLHFRLQKSKNNPGETDKTINADHPTKKVPDSFRMT